MEAKETFTLRPGDSLGEVTGAFMDAVKKLIVQYADHLNDEQSNNPTDNISVELKLTCLSILL